MRWAVAMAFCAIAAPAALAQVPREVLEAVQRLPPTGALEAALRSAVCAYAPRIGHLGRLPSNMPWARPDAVVLFDGVPGLEADRRAVVLRPTRELLARAATRNAIRAAGMTLHAHDLALLPADAPEPSFLVLHVAPPAEAPEDCVTQAAR